MTEIEDYLRLIRRQNPSAAMRVRLAAKIDENRPREFLSACGWGSVRELEQLLGRRDELLARAEHVVLWFEHDLYDQLQLLQVLATGAPGLR